MKRVGIIAEERSDVAVLNHVIGKITRKKFGIQEFVGHGCGKIIGKCGAWARHLHAQGCKLLIVVHDLDQRDIGQLRAGLTNALVGCPIATRILVIPVREIEAWLLADHEAITAALKLKERVNRVPAPESIARPKEYLGDLIYRRSGKTLYYVNTIHNVKIAKAASMAQLRRCLSFVPLERFVRANL